jgi:hypothetical protein
MSKEFYGSVSDRIISEVKALDRCTDGPLRPYSEYCIRELFADLASAAITARLPRGEDALCATLQKLNELLDRNEIGMATAAESVFQLSLAVNDAEPHYLMQDSGGFGGRPRGGALLPWEAQVIGLSRKVLDAVNGDFVHGGMAIDKALETSRKVLLFMAQREEDYLHFGEKMLPVNEAYIKSREALLKEQQRGE